MTELIKCAWCLELILKEDEKKHSARCFKVKKKKPIPAGQCPHCQKKYQRKNFLESHIQKCKKKNKTISSTPLPKKRRKSIDAYTRKKVWDFYIGQHTSALCFCCWKNVITPFTYCNTFQAGHIISHKNGGKETLENMLPICRDCNMLMGRENWDDYIARHPHLPLRRCGTNPPIAKYMKGIIWWQSLIRMWLVRKKLYD